MSYKDQKHDLAEPLRSVNGLKRHVIQYTSLGLTLSIGSFFLFLVEFAICLYRSNDQTVYLNVPHLIDVFVIGLFYFEIFDAYFVTFWYFTIISTIDFYSLVIWISRCSMEFDPNNFASFAYLTVLILTIIVVFLLFVLDLIQIYVCFSIHGKTQRVKKIKKLISLQQLNTNSQQQ